MLAPETDIPGFTREITTIFGSGPSQVGIWTLETHTSQAQFILSSPKTQEERDYGQGLYEIGFRVDGTENALFAATGYGRVALLPTVIDE